MFRKKVTPLQLGLWLMLAMSAPAVQLAGKTSWIGVALSCAVSLSMCFGVWMVGENRFLRYRWYQILQMLWLTVALGQLACWARGCWPTSIHFSIVPLILLLLAAFSAVSGAERAARVSGVLVWLVAGLYAVVLLSGLKNAKPEYLSPVWECPGSELLWVLLLPATAVMLPGKRSYSWILPAVGTGFLALCLWTVALLSYPVGQAVSWPFYEATKTLSLFGIAERFEPLVSAGATVGYFSLFSFLLSQVETLTQNATAQKGKMAVLLAAAGAGIQVFLPRLNPTFLFAVSVGLWGVLPAVGGLGRKEKNL